MRPRRLALLLLLATAPALAEDPAPGQAGTATPAAASPDPSSPAEARLPKLGLRLGLGGPDGVTASLVVRPLPSLRLHAGPAWNYLGWGVQGGVAVTPFRWAVSPVLEASYGHFFGTDLNQVFKHVPAELQSLVSDVGYDYLSGQVGLELGSPRGFTFSIGLGLSYLWSDVRGTATTVQNPGTPDQATVTVANPSLRAVIPSFRLGMLFFL